LIDKENEKEKKECLRDERTFYNLISLLHETHVDLCLVTVNQKIHCWVECTDKR